MTDDLLDKDNSKNTAELPKQRIICCPKTKFLYSVTEHEKEHVIKSFEDKLKTDYDDI
jgi:hypothetical protein